MRTESMGTAQVHDFWSAVGHVFVGLMAAIGAAWANAPVILHCWTYCAGAHFVLQQLFYIFNPRAKFRFSRFTKSFLYYAAASVVLLLLLKLQKETGGGIAFFDAVCLGAVARELLGLLRVAARCGFVVDEKVLAAIDALPGAGVEMEGDKKS